MTTTRHHPNNRHMNRPNVTATDSRLAEADRFRRAAEVLIALADRQEAIAAVRTDWAGTGRGSEMGDLAETCGRIIDDAMFWVGRPIR